MVGSTGSAADLTAAASMPRLGLGANKSIKVGFLGPLSGDVTSWGRPGRDGCLIWAERINRDGGIYIRGERFKVDIVSYDDAYDPSRALLGAKKLVYEDGVRFIMMLGGDTFPAVQDFVNQQKMLVSTLLPSDLSPDTPYLIAPSEVHPIYNVTGVEWLAKNKPGLKTAAMCAQDDSLGLPSVATYRAAFEAAGIELVCDRFFPATTEDFAAIVSEMMATGPDILCWDTAYEPFVHALDRRGLSSRFQGADHLLHRRQLSGVD